MSGIGVRRNSRTWASNILSAIRVHPLAEYGIDSGYEVPDDVFMAIELVTGLLNGKIGRIEYHDAFNEL